MKTLVTFLLDRTGSMQAIKAETIAGFNSYLDRLESEAGELVEFTMLQFDSRSIDRLYTGATLATVQRLTDETYRPRSWTPLIDACVETIQAVDEQLADRNDKPRVIVVFQTDGEENCSEKYNYPQLRKLIKEKTKAGWEFVYMGANIDAYTEAKRLGIAAANTVSYRGELSETAFAATAHNIVAYAKGSLSVGFTRSQKLAVGDAFDPSLRRARQRMAMNTFDEASETIPIKNTA